jgi:hypothetical protein
MMIIVIRRQDELHPRRPSQQLLVLAVLTVLGCGADQVCDAVGEPKLSLADYDQSCHVAIDCVIVSDLSTCSECALGCAFATLNQGSAQKYEADLENLGLVGKVCSCPPPPQPCCIGGMCRLGESCPLR